MLNTNKPRYDLFKNMKHRLLYTWAFLFATMQTFAQTYTYDSNNRIKTVVYDNGTTITYSYDALGNRMSKKVTGSVAEKYTISVTVTPTGSGTVTGGGTYAKGTTIELNALPNGGYEFSKWSDGNTDNPLTIKVTGNQSFTAKFVESSSELVGDIVPDGVINRQDLDALIAAYTSGTAATKVTDLDGDTQLTIADVTKLISMLPRPGGNVGSLTDGLVAYYPFNGNANDESGMGNHGSVIGNVELTTDRHGNANGAYRFFGEPLNYISVPDDETLHISTFTLNAWVYTDAEDYGSGYLINKGRDINDGSYRLCVNGVGAETLYGGINGANMEGTPQVNTWHMVTGTVEGKNAKYYLDGVLQDEKTLSNAFVYNNSDPLTLGIHYYSGVPSSWAYPLKGVLDDVRIYNRVLTSSEINALYADNTEPVVTKNEYKGHEYVDLGLPSGTLWATCNVGASTPEEVGCYYSWAETNGSCDGKTLFSFTDYKYNESSMSENFTKYCNRVSYGYNGFTDTLSELEAEDDAATVNWNGSWRTPTKTEALELMNKTYTEWTFTTQNGVQGFIVTSLIEGYTDRSIFLPAVGGLYSNYYLYHENDLACYWTSTLYSDPDMASVLELKVTGKKGTNSYSRDKGLIVRPVVNKSAINK